MSLFDKAKAAFAAARRVFNRVGTDLLKQAAQSGRALVGSQPREISPGEWLQRHMGKAFVNGFARATPRDERAGYKRRAKTTKTARRVNYRKRMRRLLKQRPWTTNIAVSYGSVVRDPNAVARVMVRDSLTGIVSKGAA